MINDEFEEYIWYLLFAPICVILATISLWVIIIFIEYRHALKEDDNDVNENNEDDDEKEQLPDIDDFKVEE